MYFYLIISLFTVSQYLFREKPRFSSLALLLLTSWVPPLHLFPSTLSLLPTTSPPLSLSLSSAELSSRAPPPAALPPMARAHRHRHLLVAFFLLLHFSFLASAKPPPQRPLPAFHEAPEFRNGEGCDRNDTIHVAMTLDAAYLRGSVAGILSVLRHAACPENVVFHLLAGPSRRADLHRAVLSTFPYLSLHLHTFDPDLVRPMISFSVRRALDQPLNYARFYLADLLPRSVTRVIYLDSDLILVDDIAKLWSIPLSPFILGAPEYCHANFTKYFTPRFWSNPAFRRTFTGRRTPCYFNTGVMVIDVEGWRAQGITHQLEAWMRVQKRTRIYELGSLPPFLLVFAGNVKAVEHKWNQHGLGGDNQEGRCRDLHPGAVSLLHWSGKGKPWLRLDSGRPCPLDSLWLPYDLFRSPLFLDDLN